MLKPPEAHISAYVEQPDACRGYEPMTHDESTRKSSLSTRDGELTRDDESTRNSGPSMRDDESTTNFEVSTRDDESMTN